MSSILGLISEYKDQLTALPTVIIIFVLATLLCYILFNKYKLVKYIPALIGIVVGIIFLIDGINNIVEPDGLEIIWRGLYFFVAGCIALGTAWIIALLSSMTLDDTAKKAEKEKKQARRKESLTKEEEYGPREAWNEPIRAQEPKKAEYLEEDAKPSQQESLDQETDEEKGQTRVFTIPESIRAKRESQNQPANQDENHREE